MSVHTVSLFLSAPALLYPRVRQFLTNVPLPLAGLTLGLASLAQATHQMQLLPVQLSLSLTLLAALLWLLLLGTLLTAPRRYWQQLQDPLAGSVAPTAAMALLVLSQSVPVPALRVALWYLGIGLHLTLLLIFIRARCRHWQLAEMLPSWFVPPVGILVAVVSCPGPAQLAVATVLLYFGVSAFVMLLPLMLYRLILLPAPAKAQQTSFAILAAPASLTLVAYLMFCQQQHSAPDLLLCIGLYTLALLLNLLVWLLLPGLLRQTFHPGFAALTFPLVISALASYKLTLLNIAQLPTLAACTDVIAQLQLLLATLITLYVTSRFLHWLCR